MVGGEFEPTRLSSWWRLGQRPVVLYESVRKGEEVEGGQEEPSHVPGVVAAERFDLHWG